MKKIELHMPRVGMRTVKTVISATLVAVVYAIIDRNACFACIGAVFGMGNAFRGGLQSGGNRFLGTLIGGLVSLPFYLLYHNPPFSYQIPVWAYLSFGLLLLILLCQMFRAGGSVQPGAVVFFVVIYTVSEAVHLEYVLARILDTGIGVVVSLGINHFFPSPLDIEAREKRKQAREAQIAKMESEKTDVHMISYNDLIEDGDFADDPKQPKQEKAHQPHQSHKHHLPHLHHKEQFAPSADEQKIADFHFCP